jgi:UPF0716 protein FxsA
MGFLLFIVVPGVELLLLIKVGGVMGPAAVVAMIVLTGTAGWALVKRQGLSTLRKIQDELGQARLPALEMVSGLCLLGAGLLLLTPGLLTDAVGFLMLIPGLRRMIAAYLMKRFKHKLVMVAPGAQTRQPGGRIIDMEDDQDK